MYSKGFVVAIVKDGGICSEARKDGVVALPFGSEYAIRLRNKNRKRAVATVYVDDENVSEGGIVVPAYGYVDLERPVSKPSKFKFVSAESGEAVDFGKNNKTDGSNGVIRVEWKLERERPVYVPRPPVMRARGMSEYKGGSRDPEECGGHPTWSYTSGETTYDIPVSMGFNATQTNNSIKLNEGCTVEGSFSTQNFTTTSFEVEHGEAVIIQLVLRGYEQEQVPVHNRQHCTRCGKKAAKADKFCANCGNKI